jgi:hypothetical protein
MTQGKRNDSIYVGRASIARIEETYLSVYRPRDIFPEYTDGIAADFGRNSAGPLA